MYEGVDFENAVLLRLKKFERMLIFKDVVK